MWGFLALPPKKHLIKHHFSSRKLPFWCLIITPVSVCSSLYFSLMLALKRCIMTLCLDLSLTWNKLSSCILNIWGCSVSAPLSESHTHGSSDTFQTLLILITESIEFYCGDSGPDFEPCWWDRYIRCIQDVSSVTVNISTQESGEFSQQHNVIILATLWESEQKKGHRDMAWIFKLTLHCWYHSVTVYRCEHLAWSLTDDISQGIDRGKTTTDFKLLLTSLSQLWWCAFRVNQRTE